MPSRALLIVVGLLFALTVLLRAPARWMLAAAPGSVACEMPSGSVWTGACGQLRVPGVTLHQVTWKLHLWPLLRGRLDVDLRSDDSHAPGTAKISLRTGERLALRDVQADLPIDSGFLSLFPNGWSGQLQLALNAVEFTHGRLTALQGTATARSVARRNPAMPLGSHQLSFAAPSGTNGAATNGEIIGALRDLDGPLAVSGALTIRNGRDFELSGLAAARPEASAELAKAVEFLGASDAQGRRPFSLAGTF